MWLLLSLFPLTSCVRACVCVCPLCSKNVLVWTSPEEGANPARITLVAIPSKEAVKTKAFFNVIDTALNWHPDGTFLAMRNVMPSQQLARRIRAGKANPEDYLGNTTTSVDVFRMEERDFPVDMITLKHPVTHLSWEPKGSRFAIIHATAPTATVSFFDLSKSKVKDAKKTLGAPAAASTPAAAAPAASGAGAAAASIPDIEIISERLSEVYRVCKIVNNVAWSPFGRFCVLAQFDVRTVCHSCCSGPAHPLIARVLTSCCRATRCTSST